MTSFSLVEQVLTQAAVAAQEGDMTDEVRVGLYKLALTIATEELYRIEEVMGGVVSPGALLLIQHLGLLAEPGVDVEKLVGSMQSLIEEVQDEDSGGSVPSPSEVRAAELGPASGDA